MSEKQAKRYAKIVKKNKKEVIKEFINLIASFTFWQRVVIAIDILRMKKR